MSGVDIGMGDYPAVRLSDARDKARDARRAVRAGQNPVQPRPKPEVPPAANGQGKPAAVGGSA
ncbi:DUF4102 domain-containing protein [Ottowia sp. GY511]|nr:DUF4102 domain-containing protein [Ottowia sp. GY511]